MAVAVLGLVGLFVSLYLLLHRLGFYGALLCGASGGCSTVQASRWATFLGVPVPAWGLGWYAAVFATALAALQPRLGAARWPSAVLSVLALGGAGFTAYLTFLEVFVIGAWCRWCVVSAVLVLLILLLTLPELRGAWATLGSRGGAERGAGAERGGAGVEGGREAAR